MKQAITSLVLVAAATCAVGTFAQPQTTKDGKRIGTRDEYRACLDAADAIAQRRSELEQRGAKMKTDAEERKKAVEELNADIKRLDDETLTGIARTRLERRVKEQQSRLKAADDSGAAYSADLAALEKSIDDYRGKCVNVAFENEDVDAVKKERAAAGKK